MDIEEIDVAIEELENRLERLRALYEQYFLGIEKIEPTVARKDVDRRIWLLRREQIRNTAKRFKLQTIIQRYNTFQQYWGRICREIENGTYTRHLLRAEKILDEDKLLTITARKRLGRRKKDDGAGAPQDRASEVESELAAALDNPDWNPLEEAKRAMDEVLGRDAPGARAPDARSAPREPAAPAAAPPAPPASAPARAKPAPPPRDFEKLDLDMDFLGGEPSTPAQPAPRPPVPAAPPGDKTRPAAMAAARAAAVGKPIASAPPPAPTPGSPAPPRAPAPGSPAPPRVPPPRTPAAPDRPPAAARRDPAAPAPAPRVPAAAAASAKPTGEDARLRDLHARLVDAKRRTNDTREVSVDGLRKSLQAVEDKLRQQHGNRKIDFDVVIKDGKAVVKPILR